MNSPKTMKFQTILLFALCGISLAAEPHLAESGELAKGLVASFQDDTRAASQVVALPELGLAEEESAHPTIKPAFTATYEGVLLVEEGGRYVFDTEGKLEIGGKAVTDSIALEPGKHALRLTYVRPPGEIRFGLSWESGHFVKEPVPADALWHSADSTPPAPDGKGEHPSPPLRIRNALVELKCASCHDANFLATMHHKFQPDALHSLMRHANPSKWYGAMTGPLLEEGETIKQLATDLRKLPLGNRSRGEASATPNSAKGMVGTQGGLACIACHDILHRKTEAESKGPNLALIRDRVSYDWFVRWMDNPQRLKPGVPMPAFFASQEADERQTNIDALWDYLSQGQRMELPDELSVDPNQFVLKPTGRPVFTRTYMVLSDGRQLRRAICVGLPNGLSYCFDSETCRLVYVWTGGFLDMAPHWQNQSGTPTPAVGNPFFLLAAGEGLRIGDHQPKFQGYEIVGGIPRFEFLYGETPVHLLIDASDPDHVRQIFTIGKRAEPIVFVGPPADTPVSVTASSGTWADNILTVANKGEVELVISMERKK
jgi:hypothetical protein